MEDDDETTSAAIQNVLRGFEKFHSKAFVDIGVQKTTTITLSWFIVDSLGDQYVWSTRYEYAGALDAICNCFFYFDKLLYSLKVGGKAIMP